MISFRTIFLVIATLIAAEYCRVMPTLSLYAIWLLLFAVVLSYSIGQILFMRAATGQSLNKHNSQSPANEESQPEDFLRYQRFARRKHLLENLWSFGYPLTLLFTGWLSWVNWNVVRLRPPENQDSGLEVLNANAFPGDSQLASLPIRDSLHAIVSDPDPLGFSSHLLGALLIFAPHVLALLVTEWTNWVAQSRLIPDQPGMSFRSRLRFSELSSLMTCLLPFMLVSSVRDLLKLQFLNSLSPLTLCTVALFGLVLLLTAYPKLLGRWLGATELRAPETDSRIRRLAVRVRLGRIQVRELISDGRLCTAAVVGWFPWSRAIWLSDGLLDRLSDEEVDMVVLHECAHVKYHHFYYRLVPLLWSAALTAAYFCLYQTPLLQDVPVWLGSLLTSLCAAAVLLFGMGLVARRCELDADRGACALAELHCDWAIEKPGLPAAMMATALNKTIGSHPSGLKRSWMHPSLKERLVSLADDLVRRKSRLTERTAPIELAATPE